MIPILYPSYETEFITNGIGRLSDAITCKCTEVLNGSYELELTVPIDGNNARYIEPTFLIKAKPNFQDDPQPFRIYSVEKKNDGILTAKAAHISYDTDGIPVLPFEANSLDDAISNLNTNRKENLGSPFVLSSDFVAEGEMKVEAPSSFRSLLCGGDKTIQGIYGGDYQYDFYNIYLLEKRGEDLGIRFRSSVNMVDFQEESNSEDTFYAIFGYWKKDDNIVYGDVYTVGSGVTYEKIQIVEVKSEDMDIGSSTPTADQINDYIEKYIDDNNVGQSKYSLKIGYAEDERITRLELGDTVGVIIPEYGINSTARCTKIVYDCLLERNESIELGEASSGIAEEIASLSD